MPETLINHPILQTLAITIIHFLWQGVLVAAVFKVLISFISDKHPQLRYALACAAMLACLILPVATFGYYFEPVANQSISHIGILPIDNLQQSFAPVAASDWYQKTVDYLPFLSVAWLIWVAFLTVRLLLDVAGVQRLPYHSHLAPEPEMLAKFAQLAKQIGLNRVPKLVISLKAEVPMAIGWLKPAVLMPAKMVMGLTQEQLEMLLLHELAHIRRHDYLVNFLQTLVEILLFFHPAVHWIAKHMRQEREYCSDDIAVSHCGNPVAYAHTLTDTAAICKGHHHATIPTMAMAASGGDLKERVVRLVNHSCTDSNDPGKWLAGLTIAFALFLIAAKQVVSLPTLDIHAGAVPSLSLNSEENFNPLPVTSIAQQLLAPEKSERKIVKPAETLTKPGIVETPVNTIVRTSELEAIAPTVKEVIADTPPPVEKPEKLVEILASNEQVIGKPALKKVVNKPPIAQVQEDKIAATIIDEEVELTLANIEARTIKADRVVNEPKALDAIRTSSSISAPSPIALADESQTFTQLDQPLFEDKSEFSLLEQRYQSEQRQLLEQISTREEAKLLEAIDPKYPSVAKRKGIELEVFVNFTIDEAGNVIDIQFEQQSRLSYFRTSITAAMKQWKFEPARINGEAVQSKMSKIFSFNLS
ncbi:TonB family protein [Thalassotalea euphylliae]|uniref:TonB family protein n=1 Tax=Thalassotalea euphylliae TaxID=1655234 RepID=UPI0036440858